MENFFGPPELGFFVPFLVFDGNDHKPINFGTEAAYFRIVMGL